MMTYLAVPLVCWLCALLALPRTTHIAQSVEERAYARLLGGHRRLFLVALAATVIALAMRAGTIPARMGSGNDRVISHYLPCADPQVRDAC
jgi:hypothetical protein